MFHLWVFLPLLALFDLQNGLAYWRRRVLAIRADTTRDYTVVVPLYGHPKYLQNLEYLKTIKPNVIVAIDTGSPRVRPLALRLARDGWRVHTVQLGSNVGPDSILQAVLSAGAVKTTWVVQLDGLVDWMVVYPKALSAAQVKAISSGSRPTGMSADWELNEGAGTTAVDSSGSGNTGTVVAATYVGD
jgi:hypothetical protein